MVSRNDSTSKIIEKYYKNIDSMEKQDSKMDTILNYSEWLEKVISSYLSAHQLEVNNEKINLYKKQILNKYPNIKSVQEIGLVLSKIINNPKENVSFELSIDKIQKKAEDIYQVSFNKKGADEVLKYIQNHFKINNENDLEIAIKKCISIDIKARIKLAMQYIPFTKDIKDIDYDYYLGYIEKFPLKEIHSSPALVQTLTEKLKKDNGFVYTISRFEKIKDIVTAKGIKFQEKDIYRFETLLATKYHVTDINDYESKISELLDPLMPKKKEKIEKQSVENVKTDNKNKKESIKQKILIAKGYGSFYHFYKTCKKYGSKNIAEITGKDYSSWLRKTKKSVRKLSKYSKCILDENVNIDMIRGKRNAKKIQKHLNNASLDYLINNESYYEIAAELNQKEKVEYLQLAHTIAKNVVCDFTNFEYLKKSVLKSHKIFKSVEIVGSACVLGIMTLLGSLHISNNNKVEKETNIQKELESTIDNEHIFELTKTIAQKGASLQQTNENIHNVNKAEKEVNIPEEKAMPQIIGSSVGTKKGSNTYLNYEDAIAGSNALSSYYESTPELDQKIHAAVLTYDENIVMGYDDEMIYSYLNKDYEIDAFLLENKYSYDENGNYIDSEGFYQTEDVLIRERKIK